MEFWEFLIQKEGDRSWLPLESPSTEILEGRYRIVARSSRTSVSTEIRVTHYATHESPPVQRVRKRSGQTNPDGLVVILPFTRLQPGVWEVRCTGDLMAEMMGDAWQYVLQLEVLPQETEAEDWPDSWTGTAVEPAPEPIADPAASIRPSEQAAATVSAGQAPQPTSIATSEQPTPASPADADRDLAHPAGDLEPDPAIGTVDQPEAAGSAAESPASAMAEIWQAVEEVSQQIVDSAFGDLSEFEPTSAIEPDIGAPAPPVPAAASTENATPPLAATPLLQVWLDRETLVIERGQPLLLTGRLETAAEETEPPQITQLQVRLYDPQTSQILMDEVHTIEHCIPPFPFSGVVALPQHYQTYLVLGEILFQGIDASGTERVLASRSFNVTTDLHELIESLANDFPEAEALPPEARLPETVEPVPVSDLDRLSIQAPTAFRRSTELPFPPQLRPVSPTRTHASLQLPSFSLPTPSLPTPPEPTLQDAGSAELPIAPVPESPVAPALPSPTAALSAPSPTADDPAPEPALPAPESAFYLEETLMQADGIISTTAADLQLEQPSQRARESIQKSLPELVRRSLRLAVKSSEPPADPADLANPTNLADPIEPPLIEPASRALDSTALPPADAPANSPVQDGQPRIPAPQTGQPAALLDDPTDLFAVWEEDKPRTPWHRQPRPRPIDQSTAPEDVSFRALNLQNRFWSRLQAMVTNPALSDHLRDQTGETALQLRSATGLDSALTANEIVVEDELPITPALAASDLTELPQLSEPTGPLLPEDEPIPTPRFQLPTGELTAGQPIALTVKLPSLEARVYVKLWLRDRQTRTMLGTPRWLIDFVPDGFGNQMARTEVIVPPGCLKVQFEAIAIEIASQRESDKVTITRPVVPPDLSPLSLDSLEI